MVKLTMGSAVLVVVVLAMGMAEASYLDMMNRPGMCTEQMMRQEMMSQCQRYLREVMSMDPAGRGEEAQYMDMCCQQLRDMDENCRCYGLKEAARMQTQKQERRRAGRKLEEKIMREAEMMYSQCDLSPRTCGLSRSVGPSY